jgi:hypothetical protein
MVLILTLSCHSKKGEMENDKEKDRKEYINSDNQDGLKELFISDSLRKYVIYAINKIDRFKEWPHPFYCILFEKDTINIFIGTTRILYAYDNGIDQCIGYYRFKKSIFQILDNVDLSKKQKMYSTSCLRQLSNSLLNSLETENWNKTGHRNQELILKKTSTGYRIVEEDLDYHR